MFRYTVFYTQRWCPRNCAYCLAKEVRGSKLLRPEEWERFFSWADKEGFVFHLGLGNENLAYPWIVDFVRNMRGRYYSLYTTFPEPFYSRTREKLIEAGIYSLATGVDFDPKWLVDEKGKFDSIKAKAFHGVQAMMWFISKGMPDAHFTVTVHKYNYEYLDKILDALTETGVPIAVNIVEYSEDGKHDFFGTRDVLKDFLWNTEEEKKKFREKMKEIADGVREGKWNVQQPPEYFEWLAKIGGEVGGKCFVRHRPQILAIEEDGTLRLCGYRKGEEVSKYTIFDLVEGNITLEELEKIWRKDWAKCPGCNWSWWWSIEFYMDKLGDESSVYQKHNHMYYKGKRGLDRERAKEWIKKYGNKIWGANWYMEV